MDFRFLLRLVGILSGFGAALAFGPGLSTVAAQNLDAGKTPAQLYASSCVVCHRRPQDISASAAGFSLEGFLRQHYTSGRDEAAMMAAYVRSFAGTAETPAQKRAPASRGAPKQGEQTKQAKQDLPARAARPDTKAKQDSRAKQEPSPKQARTPPDRSGTSTRASRPPAEPLQPVPQVTPPSEQPSPAVTREPEKPAVAPVPTTSPSTTDQQALAVPSFAPGQQAPVPGPLPLPAAEEPTLFADPASTASTKEEPSARAATDGPAPDNRQ